jgi:hypothetical protein
MATISMASVTAAVEEPKQYLIFNAVRLSSTPIEVGRETEGKSLQSSAEITPVLPVPRER